MVKIIGIDFLTSWGLLHKTFTGEKTPVKSANSGKHNFTIDFTIEKKFG